MIRNLYLEDISRIVYDPNKMRPFVSDAERKGIAMAHLNTIPDPRLLNRFFEAIRPHYNESQFKCIREISLINNGICLLQGPVILYIYGSLEPEKHIRYWVLYQLCTSICKN